MEPSARPGRRIRVGVAGLGAVAQAVHLPLLARLPERFEIAALADLSPSLREAMGERHRVRPTARVATVSELLETSDLDAVILLTSGSHGADALAALDRGLPVLCEKPLAFTVAEADRLAVSPNAGRLLLGYMKTFDPAVVEARRLVEDPATGLGGLRAIEVAVLHPTSAAQLAFAHLRPPVPDADPAVLAGLRDATAELVRAAIGEAAGELGGLYAGILLGSVVHEWSVIRAVAGDVVAVDLVDAWGESADDPGSVLVVARLGDGTRVSLGWHYLPGYPAYREDVRFHFVGGSVELSFPAPYRLHEPTVLTVSTGIQETRRRLVFDSIEEAFERELLAFHELVVDGARPSTGIADGRTDIVTSQRAIARWAARRGIAIGGEAAGLADPPAEPLATGVPA
ncbi:MAG TPA: Gfo/Idh/MocA family oxidoreductase [Candidatus Limnocylindrales bacterium]|jgi:predicted dehydrogenase